MAQVILLTAFIMFLFATVGVQLFTGVMRQRCVANDLEGVPLNIRVQILNTTLGSTLGLSSRTRRDEPPPFLWVEDMCGDVLGAVDYHSWWGGADK